MSHCFLLNRSFFSERRTHPLFCPGRDNRLRFFVSVNVMRVSANHDPHFIIWKRSDSWHSCKLSIIYMPSFDQPRSTKSERKSNNRKTEINENSSFETNGGKLRGARAYQIWWAPERGHCRGFAIFVQLYCMWTYNREEKCDLTLLW